MFASFINLDHFVCSCLIKLLNSKLYKFYIEINKWSGFHNKEVLKDLKYIKLDNSFTIDDLYKYFDLTPEEINLVKEEFEKV